RDKISAVWDAPLMREGVFKNLTRRSHLILLLARVSAQCYHGLSTYGTSNALRGPIMNKF
ncbi:hypothetical protein PanWU01x14_200380, partial [Parasponia andersonii]